jgi:hypothetical protein
VCVVTDVFRNSSPLLVSSGIDYPLWVSGWRPRTTPIREEMASLTRLIGHPDTAAILYDICLNYSTSWFIWLHAMILVWFVWILVSQITASSISKVFAKVSGNSDWRLWFQASVAWLMRSVLFWGITQRRVVIVYRRFGTTYRSHLSFLLGLLDPWRWDRYIVPQRR